MSKQAGKNLILKVDVSSGSPGSFATLAGQQNTSFAGDSEIADITDKANNGWRSGLQVLHGFTIQCAGVADFPEAAAFTKIRQAWEQQTEVTCRLILNSQGNYYEGSFSVGPFNMDGAYNDAIKYSFTLNNTGEVWYV